MSATTCMEVVSQVIFGKTVWKWIMLQEWFEKRLCHCNCCESKAVCMNKRVTNFSEPPHKPTGIENLILKRFMAECSTEASSSSQRHSKAQRPQLFGIWKYCNSPFLHSCKPVQRNTKVNGGKVEIQVRLAVWQAHLVLKWASKHLLWFARRCLCCHMLVCEQKAFFFTSMWSLHTQCHHNWTSIARFALACPCGGSSVIWESDFPQSVPHWSAQRRIEQSQSCVIEYSGVGWE